MSTKTLIILDGWGLREETDSNSIVAAHTPVWDRLTASYPHSRIATSGLAVGLPEGQMGNSEVGHMNLGAGRIVYQNFTRINKAIEDGSFKRNPVLCDLMDRVVDRGGALHVLGLLSPGGVHSHQDQLLALCKMAKQRGAHRVYVHAFLDGRDTPPYSAGDYLRPFEQQLRSQECGRLASLIGRYYAMDRDNRWERVEAAYRLIVEGQAPFHALNAAEGVLAAYERDESDEFIQATALLSAADAPITVAPEDGLVLMNFRPDRARQLTRALTEPDFKEFHRSRVIDPKALVTLTQYADDLPCPVAFPPQPLHNGLGEYLAGLGKRQLRIAETEKYAHVTFFFSGGREAPYAGEERIMIPSPHVASYDLKPEMSAPEVTEQLVEAIASGTFDLVVCNYANGDMVGHTGSFEAAVKAVEALDSCLGKVVDAVLASGGECLITADHGNVELMRDPQTSERHTAHTLEPVPLLYVGHQGAKLNLTDGSLSDIAPTLIELMGLSQPQEMSGRSLIKAAVD